MPFLKESELRGFAQSAQKIQASQSFIVKASREADKTIFLSHSHKDKDLALGLVNYLASLGIKLYVDWQDSGMPRVTNRTTAESIKKNIGSFNFFLILATNNALVSRWVPWEIGIADQLKPISKIAVIPVADPEGKFDGNEYLQLYNRILLEDGKLVWYEVGYQTINKSLIDWLRT